MPIKSLFIVLSILMIANQPAAAVDETRRAEMLAFNCMTCHGGAGRGAGGMKPLHDLSAAEIRERMQAFKRGEGDPTVMDRIARGYTDAEIDLIARYLAGMEH